MNELLNKILKYSGVKLVDLSSRALDRLIYKVYHIFSPAIIRNIVKNRKCVSCKLDLTPDVLDTDHITENEFSTKDVFICKSCSYKEVICFQNVKRFLKIEKRIVVNLDKYIFEVMEWDDPLNQKVSCLIEIRSRKNKVLLLSKRQNFSILNDKFSKDKLLKLSILL